MAAVAYEQVRPERLLKLVDLAAQRGLGDVETRGGPAEMKLLRNGQEVAKQTRLDVDRASLSLARDTGLGQQPPPRLSSVASTSFGDKGGYRQ